MVAIPPTKTLVEGLAKSDIASLARAITLVESERAEHRLQAQELLQRCLDQGLVRHNSLRIGITGVPGVGKSTFIDSFGSMLTKSGHRLAVLAVDPSSSVTGGSILADKTRMSRLVREANAYVRPSPAGKKLGGVARCTREAIFLCEAAGFDRIIVETVGVGQSETMVSQMTDVFLALLLPGAGDELQGIKRGLVELADLLVVNKADGQSKELAQVAARHYSNALKYMMPTKPPWIPPVLTCSATTEEGLDKVMTVLGDFETKVCTGKDKEKLRSKQNESWFWENLEEELKQVLFTDPALKDFINIKLKEVSQGKSHPSMAASVVVRKLLNNP